MAAKKQAREIEKNGIKCELLGATKAISIWIDGKLYLKNVNGYWAARRLFLSYANRHAK